MISQTLRNIATGSTKIADLAPVLDGSQKVRLRQMRLCKEPVPFCPPEFVDNTISSVMQAIYNFRRLRHADKIGVSYWMITGDDGQLLVPVDFFTMLDGKVHSIRRNNAYLTGDLDFPSNTWESDMDSLVTFVESTSKSKIVGQYLTLQNKMAIADQNSKASRAIESKVLTPRDLREIDKTWGEGKYAHEIESFSTSSFGSYGEGEFYEALDTAMQIEQFAEDAASGGKIRKNREKRITMDKSVNETPKAAKRRRKSECGQQEGETVTLNSDARAEKMKAARCSGRSKKQARNYSKASDLRDALTI